MNHPSPLPIGDRKQLFIDERFIAAQQGIRLTFNPPLKDRIVLEPASEEESHQCFALSVLEVDGQYWLYYATFIPDEEARGLHGGARHVIRVARSDDGLHWERIQVGLIDIGRGKENNIVMVGGLGTVFLDPNETEGCRFWWVGHLNENPWWEESRGTVHRGGPNKEGAIYLCCSRDGIHWRRILEPILPFWCDTRNQAFFDPRIGRYVAYLRGWRPPFRTRVVCRAESERLTAPWPFRLNPRRPVGPHGFYGPIEDELPVVMAPDELDPPQAHIYTPNVHLYPWAEEVYVAFPDTYRCRDGTKSFGRDERGQPVNEGPLDISLAVSRDGIHWHRFREPYVRLGLVGEKDGGTVYMGVGMFRRGNEIWQYCTVSPHTHHGRHLTLPGTDGGIRLLRQRLDGFVSADAGPEGGELTTPPLVFSGSRLFLNADCSAFGEVWVEIQDAEGRPIPGYTLKEAVSVDRNGIAQEVWWQGGPNVGRLAGTPIRLRFRLRAAKVYGFQFGSPQNRG